MARRNNRPKSKQNANKPLYKLTNEELETLTEKEADEGSIAWDIDEILKLRRKIDLLSRSKPFNGESEPIAEREDESGDILFCFSSSYTSLPFLFLSEYSAMGEKKDTIFPISLYLRIGNDTTLEQMKEGWAEIKYWRDYIRRAQGAQMGGEADEFLFDLHTKNLGKIGYGTLAKEVNEKLGNLLSQDLSNKKWIRKFEGDLLEYSAKKEEDSIDISKIQRDVKFLFFTRNPIMKKRVLASPQISVFGFLGHF